MTHSTPESFGGIILVAVLIGAVARNRGWNAALILLAAGLGFGLLPFGPDAPPDPEFVLILVLAPLVFGEALSSSIIDIRRVFTPVTALAVVLVVLTAGAVGAVSALLLPGLPLAAAFCLGAVLGPTDAVAVASTAKSAGLPRRVVNILEGESLLNDGTALTLLRVCSVVAVAGSVSVAEFALVTLQSVVGGLAVGFVGGLALGVVARRSRDTTVANALLLVAPLPLYASAESVGGSGILAVVVAALIFAHRSSSTAAYSGRLQATDVWRTVVFILQSGAFFLVGLEVPDEVLSLRQDQLPRLVVLVVVLVAVIVVVRCAFVYAMSAVGGRLRHHPRQWWVMGWAGTRGPISVLAAFTIPLTLQDGTPFPDRSLLITAATGVVVLSLLLSLTIPAVARRAGLPPDDDSRVVSRVRVALARAALGRLEEVADRADRGDRPIAPEVLDPLRASAELRLDQSAELDEKLQAREPRGSADRRALAEQMIHAEQEELLRLRDEEGLPDALMRQLQLEIDLRLKAVHSRGRTD